MASVRKSLQRSGKLKWQSVWNEPGPNGSTRQRTKNFAGQKEARAHAHLVAREIEGRNVGDWQKHSLESFLRRWLEMLDERNELSPTTRAGYRRHVQLAVKHIGHILLERLSPADLDSLYATLLRRGGVTHKSRGSGQPVAGPLSARSVLHVHRLLFTSLEQARKWKLIPENPARDARAPSPGKSPVRAFTEAEIGRLLDAAADDRELYCIVVLLLITGARRSEALALCWDMVDLQRRTITIKRVLLDVERQSVLREIPKTGSERTIEIPQLLAELPQAQKARCLEAALFWGKEYRKEPAMFVFARPDGEPHHPMSLTYRLRQLQKRAKVSGRAPTHAWRHTCATALIAAGSDIKIIQTRLGHSTPAITLGLYVHRTEQRDQAAGEHLAALIERQRKG
jgi:integrase